MDPLEKPPFNYAQIIAMAMMDRGRMTLKDICKWIQEHFAYFRYNKNWNVRQSNRIISSFCSDTFFTLDPMVFILELNSSQFIAAFLFYENCTR